MGIREHDCEIQLLVNDVKNDHLRLPELQRKYVWKSTQVRDFFDSLYHQYPTGQLLVWETDDLPYARDISARGIGINQRRPQLLLDGQQRLTSLYAVMTGQPVEVRDRVRTIDIVFNVNNERFEVATAAHHAQSGWVPLTKIFTSDPVDLLDELNLTASSSESRDALKRMYRVSSIKQYKYRLTILEDLSYDEVTKLFVRINSGGTRLGNADLTLAQISSRWRGVSNELEQLQKKAKALGWELDETILLRVLSAIATEQATLSQFFKSGRDKELTEEKLRHAWERAKPAIAQAIHFVKQNCLIDRPSMLPTSYILVPLAVFFDRHRDGVTHEQERDLQRWLYMALMWVRYSTSSETNLDQDITALGRDEPIKRMIQNIEDKVGAGRLITERELQDELSNSPFMVMAYVLARRNHANDWFNGVGIGADQDLEYHHIFPKAQLTQRYPERAQNRMVNQVANLAFLSQRANARISASAPADYLSTIQSARLQAQYVPLEATLWSIDRYEDFVFERRKAIAAAINDLLASLTDVLAPIFSDQSRQLETRLSALEQSLRDLIESRLYANWGASAWKRCVPGDIQRKLDERIQLRIKRNPFEQDAYDTFAAKLAQCQFSDYSVIIRSNWTLFEAVFSDKAAFDRQFVALQEARNATAHHREMNEGEQHLALGSLYWVERCLRAAEQAEEDAESEAQEEILAVAAESLA